MAAGERVYLRAPMAAGEGVCLRAPMAAGEGVRLAVGKWCEGFRNHFPPRLAQPSTRRHGALRSLNPQPVATAPLGEGVRFACFSDKLKRFTTVLTHFFRIVNALFPYVN